MEKNVNEAFQWKCEPVAEKIIFDALEQSKRLNTDLNQLEDNLVKLTSTRLFDWLDHVILPDNTENHNNLINAGFVLSQAAPLYRVFLHPRAKLPQIILHQTIPLGVAVSVESIDDFLMVRGINRLIEGTPFSGYRRCLISDENNAIFYVVERAGLDTMEPKVENSDYCALYLKAREKWLTRARSLPNENVAWAETLEIAQHIIESLGKDRAAFLVLDCERRYWQSRNTAGQVQKNRQDKLGMGWANHDHHTFRSSRKGFQNLVRLFEMLGFSCRERYYAGQEAGWGAQIMENARARLVLFLDVDLTSDEIAIDFGHEPLPEIASLGTVGLWCALHGDSILNAGMHHLEAQFMFEDLTHDLSKFGIGMMNPFSSFPYLKQAFTSGETWNVDPRRIEKLAAEKKISAEQAEKFKANGAVGSHLENLQRREGYKGFNQKNVSIIIKKTDPRSLQN